MGDRVRRSKRQRREQRVEVDALTGRRIRSTAAPSHQNTASDSPSSPHRQLRLPPVRSRVPVAFLMPATTVAAAAASAQAEAVMGEQDRTAGWVQTTLGLGTATGAGTAVPAATGADATSADAPQTVAAAVAQQPVVSGRRVTVVTSPLQSPVIAPIATSSSGDGGAGAPMEKLRAQPSRYYLPSDDGRGTLKNLLSVPPSSFSFREKKRKRRETFDVPPLPLPPLLPFLFSSFLFSPPPPPPPRAGWTLFSRLRLCACIIVAFGKERSGPHDLPSPLFFFFFFLFLFLFSPLAHSLALHRTLEP